MKTKIANIKIDLSLSKLLLFKNESNYKKITLELKGINIEFDIEF